MKSILKKLLCITLLICLTVPVLSSCDKKTSAEPTKLSFRAAAEYDFLKSLDGQPVTINGYMATSSPVDGSFMFLMNLPYQSCPFCVPNTSQLSNTIEVYPKGKDRFTYTTQAIRIEGTLQVAKNENEPFTDQFGYEFNYKIVDATYTIIQADELSADMALWQKIAESDVVSEIYKMYDYVNFVCAWNTYFVNSYTDENGKTKPGYYLYPSDAERYLFVDGAQWNYGYQEGYFDKIIAKIQAIDENAFASLVKNIEDAKALSEKAIAELKNKNYTYEYKYVEKFGTEDNIYTINKGEELSAEMKTLYAAFSNWLGSWEL